MDGDEQMSIPEIDSYADTKAKNGEGVQGRYIQQILNCALPETTALWRCKGIQETFSAKGRSLCFLSRFKILSALRQGSKREPQKLRIWVGRSLSFWEGHGVWAPGCWRIKEVLEKWRWGWCSACSADQIRLRPLLSWDIGGGGWGLTGRLSLNARLRPGNGKATGGLLSCSIS